MLALAVLAQLLLVAREAGNEVVETKPCMMIDSLEVLGSTLAANDVVVAAFTTAQLSADDAPVCSEDLRSKFPDLQFGIASGVRSREFAPVIPIIHEDPTIIMFVDYGASRVVLRSRLLKEALSSEGEANTLVAQFVQNTLDEHRGNKKVGGVEVGDPPIYQDEHQAYVNFLFNKTTAFLDRTEAWHMLIFADYASSGTKWLNDVLEAVQPQLRGEVLMLRMNQEDSKNVMTLLNVQDHMLPQPVMLKVANRKYEQMNEESITENGLIVFAENFITKSEGQPGKVGGIKLEADDPKLDISMDSTPQDLLTLCENRFSAISNELQELKGGWHRGRQQMLEQTQQQQLQMQGQLEEQFNQKCEATLEDVNNKCNARVAEASKARGSKISVTCKENTECSDNLRRLSAAQRGHNEEVKQLKDEIGKLRGQLAEEMQLRQAREKQGEQGGITCDCDEAKAAIKKKCRARLAEESELREEVEQEAYEDLRTCTEIKDELRKKLLEGEGESCTEINGDDISQELQKLQAQLSSMAKRAKKDGKSLESTLKEGHTAVAKSVAEKLEKGTSMMSAANGVAEKLDTAIQQLRDSPNASPRGEVSTSLLDGVVGGFLQALSTVALGAAILAFLLRKGKLAGVFDKAKSAEDVVWDKAIGSKGGGDAALVQVVRTEMTSLRTTMEKQLDGLSGEKKTMSDITSLKEQLVLEKANVAALKRLNTAHEQENNTLSKQKLKIENEQRKGTESTTQRAVESAVQASLGSFAAMQKEQSDQLRQLRKAMDTQPSSDLLMQNAMQPLLEANQEHCDTLEEIRAAQKDQPGFLSAVAPLQKALDHVANVQAKQGTLLDKLQTQVTASNNGKGGGRGRAGGGGDDDMKDAIQSVLDSQEETMLALRAVQAESTAIRHNTNANTATLRSLQLDMSRAQRAASSDARNSRDSDARNSRDSGSHTTARGPGAKGSGFSSSRTTDLTSRHGGKSVKRYDTKDLASLRPSNTDKPDSLKELEKKISPGAWAQGDGKTIFEPIQLEDGAASDKKEERTTAKGNWRAVEGGDKSAPPSPSRSNAGADMLKTLQQQTGKSDGGKQRRTSKGDANWREPGKKDGGKDKKDGKDKKGGKK
jgi:hypothetical protein